MNTATATTVTLHWRAPETGAPDHIHYAIGNCTLGALLVARSTRGICAIFLDDSADGLRRQLARAFPTARSEPAPAALQHELAQVVRFIDDPAAAAQLDLDIGGTPFQQRVWRELAAIPAGRTHSYSDIAQRIGAPAAVRAVAGACAANVLAVAIPCHRVTRRDGSISGYRWGVQRKHALLLREHG